MKRTDHELNTIFDDVTAQVTSERLDPQVVSSAANRGLTRMAGEEAAAQAGITPVEQIRGCEDFQTLITAYMEGLLSPARTMLLEDHTRECVPCRKALKMARSGNRTVKQLELQQARAARSNHRMLVLRWGIAAVLAIGLGMGAWPWVNRFISSVGTLQ